MPRRMNILIIAMIALIMPVSRADSKQWVQCFPDTPGISDCLAGRFAQYWETNGGIPVFGYPTTPLYDAKTADGSALAQMVERNRLEYHPELPPPYDMLLGRLGSDRLEAQGRDWHDAPYGKPQSGCWYASETRHTVCDQEPGLGFLTFYRTHGLELGDPGISERESLALWGFPLTEPAYETNAAGDRVLTQWFERARFEYHPDKPPIYRVLLGLLGREAWGAAGRPRTSTQPIPGANLDTSPGVPPPPMATPIDDDPGRGPRPEPSSTQEPLQPTPTQVPNPTATPSPTNMPSPTTMPSPTVTQTPLPSIVPTDDPFPSPTATPPSTNDGQLKQRLWDLISDIHINAGCDPFVRDMRLEQAAQAHDDDIASHKIISHIGTDGSTIRDRMRRVGYPFLYASEGIAVYRSPEEVVHFWMDEPPDGPHRQNLTNCKYTDGGVGLAYDDRGWVWWVLDVGGQR